MSNRDQLRIQAVTTSARASGSLVPESLVPPPQTPPRTATNSIVRTSTDTPMTVNSQGPETGFRNMAQAQATVLAELEGHDCEITKVQLENMFVNVTSEKKILSFLTKTNLYRNRRWTKIPKVAKLEEELYKPLCNIFTAILVHFKYSNRTAIDSHAIGLPHVEGSNGLAASTPPKTSPDIIIKGSDYRNFGPNPVRKKAKATATTPDYRSCVSPVEVKTEKNPSYPDNLAQIGVYVRQCFIQQKNRRFVYSLIVTEKHFQLFHFDRSGVFHSVKINIHEHASTFVRIVLGICSEAGAVGFDTSIYWEGDKRYLRTLDENQKEMKVTLKEDKDMFYRRTIRCRGTVCWPGLDNRNRLVIIKDAWRSTERGAEWDLLKRTMGLAGVGQLLGWEENKELTTANLRRFDHEMVALFVDFRNRMFDRLLMEAYGATIEHFRSREELIYAFRDAVAGHRNLWEAGILHRDVSVNNVLIGKPNAEVGNRGVLIDLDMAILLARNKSLANVDFRTGTRAFQSISVLSSVNDTTGQALGHDYLDDLESFFYVLCWVTIGYSRPKEPLKGANRPRVLLEWDDNDANIAANSKMAMVFHLSANVAPYFGPPFQTLLSALLGFLHPHIKSKLIQRNNPEKPQQHLTALKEPAKVHYAAVLEFIDEAILALESESYTTPTPVTPARMAPLPLPCFPAAPTLSHSHSGSSLKRQADEPDIVDGSPKSKKQNRRTYAKNKRPSKTGSDRSGR